MLRFFDKACGPAKFSEDFCCQPHEIGVEAPFCAAISQDKAIRRVRWMLFEEEDGPSLVGQKLALGQQHDQGLIGGATLEELGIFQRDGLKGARSGERRVGNEWVIT